MMLIGVYESLFKSLQKAHPEMSHTEIRNLMAREANQAMQPKVSEKQLIAWINYMCYEKGKPMIRTENNTRWENESRFEDVPGKCADGKYLPGYIAPVSEEERQLRRAQSEAARNAYFTAVEKLHGTIPDVKKALGRPDLSVQRQAQRLFVMENPTDPPEEKERIRRYNKEVADLFGTDADSLAEQKKWKDALKKENPEMTDAEVDKALRARRGQILMADIHKRVPDVNRVDTLFKPGLTPEEMAADAEYILDVAHLYNEAKDFRKGAPEVYILSAEDEAFLEAMNRRLNVSAARFSQVAMIANPAYEFLTPEMLQYVDIDTYHDRGDEGVELPVGAWDRDDPDIMQMLDNRLNVRMAGANDHADGWAIVDRSLSNPIGIGPEDTYNTFFYDFSIGYTDNYPKAVTQIALESYAFPNENGQQTYFVENDDFSLSESTASINEIGETPVVAVMRNHYRIFQKQPNGSIAAVPADTQFKYKLEEKVAALRAQMAEADPPGHHGKNEFRRMREAFETLNDNLHEYLREDNLGRYMHLLQRRYGEMIQRADAYIQTKQRSLNYIESMQKNAEARGRSYNLTRNERWDVRRTDMAKRLKAFAQLKLKELELAERAQSALNVRDMSPETRRKEIEAWDRAWQAEQRKQHPGEWLRQQLSEVYTGTNAENDDIPASIINGLKPIAGYDNSRLSHLLPMTYYGTIGRMIAAEQIKLEDSMRQGASNGKLRKFYAIAKDEDFIKLGQETLCELYNVKDRLNLGTQVRENFLKNVNVREAAAEMLDYAYLSVNEFAMNERLRGYYLNSIHPMRSPEPDVYDHAVMQFVKDNIITPYDVSKKNAPVDGKGNMAKDAACNLLANCVIASMVQKERKQRGWQTGPGVLEEMLANDPQGVDQLRQQILASDMFKFMNQNDYMNVDQMDDMPINEQVRILDLRSKLQDSSDVFASMLKRNYMAYDTVKYVDLAKLIDLQLPQQIADIEYQSLMQGVMPRRNGRLYENLRNEGIDLELMQFRTLNGDVLDPFQPEDLTRIVSGETLYAAQFDDDGEKTAEFIFRGGPNQQIVSNAASDRLKKALADYAANKNIDASNAVFRMGVGSPISIPVDRVIDLNTVEGANYALSGDQIVVTLDPEHQVQLSYNDYTGNVTLNEVDYQNIKHAMEKNGIPAADNKAAFNRADGSVFHCENLYDQSSSEYSYLMAGNPITVTAEDGHQITITRGKDGAFATAPTAHDNLVKFFNGKELKQLQDKAVAMGKLGVPPSGQYDNVLASLALVTLNQPKFGTEQFVSDDIRKAITALADAVESSADQFLHGEGYRPEQEKRLGFVDEVKAVAGQLRALLAEEQNSRPQAEKAEVKAADQPVNAPDKPDNIINDNNVINNEINESIHGMRENSLEQSLHGMRENELEQSIHEMQENTINDNAVNNNVINEKEPEKPVEAPKADVPQPPREKIVNWLFRYYNYLNNGSQNNFSAYMAEMRKNGVTKISRKEASRRMPYKPGEYTEAQLKNAGIDINVLQDSVALSKFLQAEDPNAKIKELHVEIKHAEPKVAAEKEENVSQVSENNHDEVDNKKDNIDNSNNIINSNDNIDNSNNNIDNSNNNIDNSNNNINTNDVIKTDNIINTNGSQIRSEEKGEEPKKPAEQKPVEVSSELSSYLARAKELNEAQRQHFANAKFFFDRQSKKTLNAEMDTLVQALSAPISEENLAKLRSAISDVQVSLNYFRENGYNMPALDTFFTELADAISPAAQKARKSEVEAPKVEAPKETDDMKLVAALFNPSSYLAEAQELNKEQWQYYKIIRLHKESADEARQKINDGMDAIVETLSKPLNEETIDKLQSAMSKVYKGMRTFREEKYNVQGLWHFLVKLERTLVNVEEKVKEAQKVEEKKVEEAPKPEEKKVEEAPKVEEKKVENPASKQEDLFPDLDLSVIEQNDLDDDLDLSAIEKNDLDDNDLAEGMGDVLKEIGVKKFPEDKLQIEPQEEKMLPGHELRQLAKKYLEEFRNVRKNVNDDVKKSLKDWPDRLEDVFVKMATEPIPWHLRKINSYVSKCENLAKAYTKQGHNSQDTAALRAFCSKCEKEIKNVKIPDKWANMPKENKDLFEADYPQQNGLTTAYFCEESGNLVNMKLRIDDHKLDKAGITADLNRQLREDLASSDVYNAYVENVGSRADKPAPPSELKKRILQNATIKGILLNEENNSLLSYGPLEQMIMNGKFKNIDQLGTLVFKTPEVQKLYKDSVIADMYGFIAYQGYRDMANQIIPKMYKGLQQTAQKMDPNPKLQQSSRAAEVTITPSRKNTEPPKTDASKALKKKNGPKA